MNSKCMSCGKPGRELEKFCSECGSTLEIIPEDRYSDSMMKNFRYIRKWISLGEVVTPIIEKGNVSFKLDYFQPTFSYKDRGARVALSALHDKLEKAGVSQINEDSSGNAGSSIAAYGRAAGFDVNIFVPESVNEMKLKQIRSYGANIITVKGGREKVAEEAKNHEGFHLSHTLVPEFRDGIRSLAYEIYAQYGGSIPDRIFLPVSAGTLFLGMLSGFNHLLNSGEINRIPEIICVQSQFIAPICSALGTFRWIDDGRKSIADALVTKVSPLLSHVVVRLKKVGNCVTVNEEEIADARNRLAASGMLAEYSSATVYAAFMKKNYEGKNLLVLTGNGLKNL